MQEGGAQEKRRYFLAFLAIVMVVCMLYAITVRNGFIHDDHGQVEANTYIHSLMYLPRVFTGCIWESAVGNCKETYYYRPLQSLSYLLTYQFSPASWIFHLVNMVYFSIVVFLVFVLVYLLSRSYATGLLAAGLFVVHPLNTEVVNWIAAVPELLYTLFVLIATIFFYWYRTKKKLSYLYGVAIAYGLAIYSKEPAVFLPFVFVAMDGLFFRRKNLTPYIVCVCIFLVYMGMRFGVLGGLGVDPSVHYSLWERTYAFFDLFGAYVNKLVWPVPLNLFYPYHPGYAWMDRTFLIGIVLTVFYGWMLVFFWKKQYRLLAFSFVWYGVFLAPSLLFTASIGENLFAERHVFASTIGFAIVLALGLRHMWKRDVWARIGVGICCIVLAVFSSAHIHARNTTWRSDEIIYADTLNKSPDADLIRYNLAYLYGQSGKISRAKEQYDIIIKRHVWRGIDKVYNNLGDIARKDGDYTLAIAYFQKSLVINPLHVEAYNNLGALLLEKGDVLGSLTYLCQANRIHPAFQPAANNLDRLVGIIQGMDERAFEVLYKQLVTDGMFHLDKKNIPIAFKKKECSVERGCLLTFSNSNVNTQIFTFLIGGQTTTSGVVRPRRVGFEQATGNIVLDIDPKWMQTEILFSFPTCDTSYYQVSSKTL